MRRSWLIPLVIVTISTTVTMAQTKKPGDQNDTVSPAAGEKGSDFWTPERMREAKPTPLPKLTREQIERLKNKK